MSLVPLGGLLAASILVAAAGALGEREPVASDPIMLAHVESCWSRPTVATDRWGRVHVVWGAARPGGPILPDCADMKPDALYHRVWDGRAWSDATPIVLKGPGDPYVLFPVLASAEDQVYLAWSAAGVPYVSRAPALLAHRPEAWSPPRQAGPRGAEKVRLVAASEGVVHLLLNDLGSDAHPVGAAIFVRSDDGGATWTEPVQISQVAESARAAVSEPALALDRTGRLHAAWSVSSPPNWIGHRVEYARSSDGGRSWTVPQTLATADAGVRWVDDPSLIPTPDGLLHLLYACGIPPTRCYRRSADAGATWSDAERPFGDLVGMGGWDATVGDAESGVHLFALLRYPKGLYHAAKPAGRRWGMPTRVVTAPLLEEGHFPALALSDGNQLHGVFQAGNGRGDVMYVRIATDAPARPAPTPPAELPTLAPTTPADTPLPTGRGRRRLLLPLAAVALLIGAAVLVVLVTRARRRG